MWMRILIATLITIVLLSLIVGASAAVVQYQKPDTPKDSEIKSTEIVVYEPPKEPKTPELAGPCYHMIDDSSDIAVVGSAPVAELSDGSMKFPEVTSTDLFFQETSPVRMEETPTEAESGYELGHVGVSGQFDNYTLLSSVEESKEVTPSPQEDSSPMDNEYTILPVDHYSNRMTGQYVPSYRDSFPTLPKLGDGKLVPTQKTACACDGIVSEHEYTRTPMFISDSERK